MRRIPSPLLHDLDGFGVIIKDQIPKKFLQPQTTRPITKKLMGGLFLLFQKLPGYSIEIGVDKIQRA